MHTTFVQLEWVTSPLRQVLAITGQGYALQGQYSGHSVVQIRAAFSLVGDEQGGFHIIVK